MNTPTRLQGESLDETGLWDSICHFLSHKIYPFTYHMMTHLMMTQMPMCLYFLPTRIQIQLLLYEAGHWDLTMPLLISQNLCFYIPHDDSNTHVSTPVTHPNPNPAPAPTPTSLQDSEGELRLQEPLHTYRRRPRAPQQNQSLNQRFDHVVNNDLEPPIALRKGSYRVEQHKGEVLCFSILTDTRHKINHFVATLQQYVQSQLSQVSWCRFLNSIKHKVEDMLDLEAVHMLYLTESLRICFLSSETQSTARIIQNILQCAMDYRSCLTGRIWEGRSCDERSSNRFSEIDVSQVRIIRRTFTKNLEELRLLHFQSPKHAEFGISHFWDYLNYNEYYSETMDKQIGHSIF